MTRDNKKHHLTSELNDFDAVSLYPSAMHRLYIPTGAPRKLRPDELTYEYSAQIRAAKMITTSLSNVISSTLTSLPYISMTFPAH